MDQEMKRKADMTTLVYDDLRKRLNIQEDYHIHLIVDENRKKEFCSHYFEANPFTSVLKVALVKLRKKAMTRLFEKEDVIQTPVIAAVLSLCSGVAADIGSIRNGEENKGEIYTDLAYAGMQAVRLYIVDSKGKEFRKTRINSAIRVDNAWNGSFYKYETKDHRCFSYHVYYQSQQEKLVKALNSKKKSEDYRFMTTSMDKKRVSKLTSYYPSEELEEKVFDCGACGCKIRSREEWESSPVGKAVKEMPLIDFRKQESTSLPSWGKCDKTKGPLSGIKVLDFTHIIAGPVCSRLLAEYGADVLLVRRGKFVAQEQAMLELDGWAGKNSIQLDLNKEEERNRVIELIKEADVITYSYQNGVFDKFGLSIEEIRKLNPNVIYSNLMCFSTSVWVDRPGWAPCAEDITGLSVRNGSLEKPKNLNGVPLDYIPGMFLGLGTLLAIKEKLLHGTTLQVTTSLTRGAQYLHEATDLVEKTKEPLKNMEILTKAPEGMFTSLRQYVDTSIGKVGFPSEATYNTAYPFAEANLSFTDGNEGFKHE